MHFFCNFLGTIINQIVLELHFIAIVALLDLNSKENYVIIVTGLL